MNIRRILCCAFLLCMAFALAACGSNDAALPVETAGPTVPSVTVEPAPTGEAVADILSTPLPTNSPAPEA